MLLLLQKIYELFELEENKQLLIDAGLQPIATIDLYRGQTLNPEQFEFYATPALFLQWKIRWNKRSVSKVKNGIGELIVHVVSDAPVAETGSIFTNYNEALAKVMGYQTINEILQGCTTEMNSGLDLVDEYPVDTGVMAYQVQVYEFTAFKTVPQKPITYVGGNDGDVEVSGELIKQL